MATSRAMGCRTHCWPTRRSRRTHAGSIRGQSVFLTYGAERQRLDVRFIQFDNVVIELLQYRDADQPMGSPKSFPNRCST